MRREVLVTGTNSGFGLLTAVHLAGLGFHVVGTVRSADKLDAIESAAAHAGVLPLMRRRGEGRIVNKSSTAAHVTGPMIGWYQVAKRALAAATRALRTEVDGFGVELLPRRAQDRLLRNALRL